MITFMDSKEGLKEVEKCLDPQLWHACAGGMVQMPAVNAKVYYFPEGHAEHACAVVDLSNLPRLPPYILCRVSAIKFMADPETDEVYAKIRLVPLVGEADYDDDGGLNGPETPEKPTSFAKTLTQSDANNGGGFSVPRYCAETIFPRLDYTVDPPVQNILAKDVHGESWKFRHIYRGTPRRHLLTTGWSTFVNHKKLVAGDSIVFLRAEIGDLCVGIRRAKRGIGGGPESASGWNPTGGNCTVPYGGLEQLMRNGNGSNSNGNGSLMGKGKVAPESVLEAARLASNRQPFEIVYYPRASTPEFCVKASLVNAAFQIGWHPGMRFKMAFETEDSSRISWFMGTVSSVKFSDSLRRPASPWRSLEVHWDEPDLLQNVTHVSPWLVEVVSTMLPIHHLTPFSPPRKKLRQAQQPEFPFGSQIPMPTFSGNLLGSSSPFGCLPDKTPAGMQGARHPRYGGRSFSDMHLNKLQTTCFFPTGFVPMDHSATFNKLPCNTMNTMIQKPAMSENVSCLLTMSPHSVQTSEKPTSKRPEDVKPPQLVLFGKPILTEQQISLSSSGDTVSPVGNSSSDGHADKMANHSDNSGSALNHQSLQERSSCEGMQRSRSNGHETDPNLKTGHCKVFMESEDVGRTLDLSLLGSYEELCRKLAEMFGIENSEGALNHLLYRDATGAVKHIGDEPFGEFMKTARRLTILMDSGSNNVGL